MPDPLKQDFQEKKTGRKPAQTGSFRASAPSGKEKIKNLKPAGKKRRPPGQRLIAYLACAFALISISSVYIPAGTYEPCVRYALPVPLVTDAFELKEPLEDLQQRMKSMSVKPKLHLGAFAVEPASGRHVSIDGEETFAAASMIKVPVLVKLLVALDASEVSLDEKLVLRSDLVGGGSGYLQWRPLGSKVSMREAMETMIIFSDNTSTNLIIDRLGGKDVCNRDFAFWGLKRTYISNWLPDLTGTNKTSPYDLVQLLARVDKGELLSSDSRKRMLSIMEKTRIKTLLPFGLPAGARIFHKTGDIGSLVGDCGIISCPDGRRLIACVQVARPHNDRRANELIRQVARVLYAGMASNSPAMISQKKNASPL
jgi:beta-lactamase class A